MGSILLVCRFPVKKQGCKKEDEGRRGKKSHMSQFHSPFLALLATDNGLGYGSRGGGATDLEIGPYLQPWQNQK